MTRPEKVVAFLDIGGAWDPSLAFVMVGAIGVYAILFRLIARRPKPLFGVAFQVPAVGPAPEAGRAADQYVALTPTCTVSGAPGRAPNGRREAT
jgi:hypothetical protein